MDNSLEITVLVYSNESIIQNTDEGVIFMSSKQIYFYIPQTILFEELNVELCESINIGTKKRVVKIKYRYLILIVDKKYKISGN